MSNIKKANKILMATVAILLCLVLISTSVVSGVFSRFVYSRTGDTTTTIKAFGVTLEMTHDENLKTAVGQNNVSAQETLTKDGYTFTISNLIIYPGCVFPKAVKFTFTGAPTVDVQVKITPTIKYNDVHTSGTKYHNFCVDPTANDHKVNLVDTMTYYMPLGFTFSSDYGNANSTNADLATNATVLAPWSSSTNKDDINDTAISQAIAAGIATGENKRLKDSTATGDNEISVSGNVITIGTFKAGTAIKFSINSKEDNSLNCFSMGFYYPLDWPGTSTSGEDWEMYNKLATYFAKHTNPKSSITITYRVEIVQV